MTNIQEYFKLVSACYNIRYCALIILKLFPWIPPHSPCPNRLSIIDLVGSLFCLLASRYNFEFGYNWKTLLYLPKVKMPTKMHTVVENRMVWPGLRTIPPWFSQLPFIQFTVPHFVFVRLMIVRRGVYRELRFGLSPNHIVNCNRSLEFYVMNREKLNNFPPNLTPKPKDFLSRPDCAWNKDVQLCAQRSRASFWTWYTAYFVFHWVFF